MSRALLSLVFWVALSGCPSTSSAPCDSDVDCPDGRCRYGGCGPLCRDDTDCPTGLTCSEGACRPRPECAASSDCAQGFTCQDGRCLCTQRLCQELTRCSIDADCPRASDSGAFCQQGHCQPTPACGPGEACASGRVCVAGLCMPGGCRGHADCAAGQACTEGDCRAPPSASEIIALALSPRAATLVVGGTVQLSLVAFTVSGGSFPLSSGAFSVVEAGGAPSDAATVTASGLVTAAKAGGVRVRAGVTGAAVTPAELTLTVLPALAEGRRVTVVDAASGHALSGVEVLGCDAPPPDAPCPAPVTVTTDASGSAAFPGFNGASASFSAASPESRSDGLPRYDRVSVAATGARDVLLPLTENPVHAAAGFNAAFQFNEVHSTGELWLGFSVLSGSDVPALDVSTLLGEPFFFTVPGLPLPLPAPGSLVAYGAVGLGSPVPFKDRSLGLGQAGRRAAVAFAGRTGLSQVGWLGSTDLLAYTGAMDYALQAFTSVPHLPRVPDVEDLDGDGLCADAAKCPQGSEDVPDYFRFPGFSHRPRREQLRRTEVVLPRLPPGFDTAVVSAVELSADAGLVPLGFSSRTAGVPLPDGTRPVEPVLLRSGAPYAGVEASTPAVWALALQRVSGAGGTSGRLVRGPTLPTRVEVPPFLPLPAATYDTARRVLSPSAGSWNALIQAGAELGRVTLTGLHGRHVVLFALEAGVTAVRVPESPALVGEDPAGQASPRLEVVAMDLSGGTTAQDALDVAGPNLTGLPVILEAYTSSRP